MVENVGSSPTTPTMNDLMDVALSDEKLCKEIGLDLRNELDKVILQDIINEVLKRVPLELDTPTDVNLDDLTS